MKYSEDTHLKILDELKHDFEIALEKIDFSDYRPDSSEFMYVVMIGLLRKLLKDNEDPIQEEIDGAWEYFNDYKNTSNSAYKEMALDELKHAKILIGMSKLKHPGKSFSDYEKEISEIQTSM